MVSDRLVVVGLKQYVMITMSKNNIEDTFTHKFAEKFNENEKFIEDIL